MAVTYAWRLDADKYAYIVSPKGEDGYVSESPLASTDLNTVALTATQMFGENGTRGISGYNEAYKAMLEKISDKWDASVAYTYTKTDGIDTYGNEVINNFGYIQRGGAPNMQDRILAAKFGYKAVELLKENSESRAIGIKDNKVIAVPFEEALKAEKKFDKELYNIEHILSL